jgi:glycosyltransferase involved in cell wall biosynthesis
MSPGPAPNVLYIVYWGAVEPLGQSLVLPPVVRLAQLGVSYTLLTFEKADDLACHSDVARIRDRLRSEGIRWVPLRYHKRPKVPATAFDIAHGWYRGLRAARAIGRFDLVHARTFTAGPMGLVLAKLFRLPLVYHNEGFYPDEQVDGGVWRRGSVAHRGARALEGLFYREADGIVVLSQRAREAVESLPAVSARRTPVIVVPSTVDLQLFPWRPRSAPATGPLRLVYIGAVGGRYVLDQAARFAAVAGRRAGGVCLRILTRADRALVNAMVDAGDLSPHEVSIDSLPHAAMAAELARHHAGLFFLTRGISEHGCSPTKIGEYWASGLPVVTTPNVSDTDAIIRQDRVGVIVEDDSEASYASAADELMALLTDPALAARCRAAAERHYGLEPAAERLLELYRALTPHDTAQPV